jgi:D-alanyl-D-alanine carboxypeptidase
MSSVTSSRTSLFLKLLACACAGLLVASLPAEAGKKPRKEATAKRAKKPAKPAAGGYAPPYAALVVDAKTGKVLFADSAEAIRHPASLTKVMTLYLLFDELERGAVTLKTPLTVSAEAARQAPSKLGLRVGETIMVEDAIKALVTKSANDVAVTIAENIAGSEPAFAQRMTRKARALGMSATLYRNASGLPNPEQITTARDLVILGRAIQDNHPNYYGYFSTRNFVWRGQNFGNHNKLLGSVKGVDGIKTGYVRASGFNLLTSAQQNGRQVVAVVLGGKSSSSRDAHMRDLVQTNIVKASGGPRTAPLIAEAPMPAEPMPALATARASASAPSPAALTASPILASVPVPSPRPGKTTTVPVPTLPDPVMAAIAASAPATPLATEDDAVAVAPVRVAQIDGGTAAQPIAGSAAPVRSSTMTPEAIAQRIATATAMVTTTPSTATSLGWKVGAQPVPANAYAGTTPGTTPASAPRPAPVAIAAIQPPAAKPAPVAKAVPAPVAVTASVPVETPPPVAPVVSAALAATPASSSSATPAPAVASMPLQTAQNDVTIRTVKTVTIQPPVEAGLYPAPLSPATPPASYAAAHPVVTQSITPQPAAPMAAPAPKLAAVAPMPEPAMSATPPRPGWMIQIAASPDLGQAEQLLERVTGAVKSADRKAEPYTEPVQKDGVTLYRARFAGLNEQSAVQACKAVKRASMSCFTLKN